jgi:hypothetical protein
MFENFPISSAKFVADGSELLLGSEYRAHMQSYDMETGRALHIPCPVSGPEISSMSVSITVYQNSVLVMNHCWKFSICICNQTISSFITSLKYVIK